MRYLQVTFIILLMVFGMPKTSQSSASENVKQASEFLIYDNQRVRLDIYRPISTYAPVAILIHGAAGIEGDRAQRYQRFASDLAQRGIVAINVHYFNSPRSHWVKTILETIEYAAKMPGVNPNRIALIGYSLGGSLAVAASLESERVNVLVINSGALPNNFSQKDVANLPRDIYMSCGTEDFCYPSLEKLEQMTSGTNKNFTKRARKGEGHSVPESVFWQQWNEILNYTASRLK